MKISMKTLVTGMIALAITGTSATVFANGRHDHHDEDKAKLVQQEILSLEQAVKVAVADMPGKVIEAELDQERNLIIWEIELVNDQSQIFEFEIDAKTGDILTKERDHHDD